MTVGIIPRNIQEGLEKCILLSTLIILLVILLLHHVIFIRPLQSLNVYTHFDTSSLTKYSYIEHSVIRCVHIVRERATIGRLCKISRSRAETIKTVLIVNV